MRAALAAAAALLITLMVSGAATAASPIPGTLGLRLTPAPVRLDDGERTVTATNLSGGLALSVALVADPPTYAVEPATFTLADGASQLVTLTAVDPSADGTLTASAAADVAGPIRSAVSLRTRLLHRTFLERVAGTVGPWVPLAGVAALLCALFAGARAIRRRVPA